MIYLIKKKKKKTRTNAGESIIDVIKQMSCVPITIVVGSIICFYVYYIN